MAAAAVVAAAVAGKSFGDKLSVKTSTSQRHDRFTK